MTKKTVKMQKLAMLWQDKTITIESDNGLECLVTMNIPNDERQAHLLYAQRHQTSVNQKQHRRKTKSIQFNNTPDHGQRQLMSVSRTPGPRAGRGNKVQPTYL